MVTESNVHGTSYPPTEEVNTAHEGISHSKLNNKPEANNLDTPESTQPVPVSINKTRRVVIIKMKKKNIISCTVMKKFQTQTSKLSNRVVKTPILYNTPLLQIKKNASELLNSKQNNKSESRVVVEPLPGSHTPVQNNTDSSQSPNHQLNKEIKSIIELNVRKDKPHVSFDKYWVDSCTGYIKKKNDQENHAIYFQLQNSGNNSKQVLLNFKMDMYPYFNIVEPINFEDNGNLTKSETSPLCTKILKVAKNLIKNPNEFKCQFLTDCKLEQTSPTSWIHTCIYCTPEFAKDLQQIPALATNDLHICDPLKSLLSIKPVATNAPVSELFEDALELISEDENYLERIENDMKRLCIFCSWIGSKWFLEDHLRQNHMRYISTFEKEEWVMPYNMHNLLDYSMWMPFVVQYQSALYVMAIKYYVEEDLIVASIYFVPKNGYAITKLAHLKSMGNEQTTTCTWFGPVKEFPYELPCHKDISCFKFKLSELKIIHKIHTADNDKVSLSLFPEGGNKRRSLNDIYIALFIKLYDIETNLDAS